MSKLRWITLCLASLFWWSNSGFGLFSRELVYIRDAGNSGAGTIHCLYDTFLSKETTLEWHISFIDQLTVRNTIINRNAPAGFLAGMDFVYIPGFTEIDDAGMERKIVPLAFAARAGYDFSVNQQLFFGLRGNIGLEYIGIYSSHIIYSLLGVVGYSPLPSLKFAMDIGFDEDPALKWGVGGQFLPGNIGFDLGMELDGRYKTGKAGVIIAFNKKSRIRVGGDYTLEYGGWNAGLNFETNFKIFNKDSRLGLGFSVSGAGLFSIQYSQSIYAPYKKKKLIDPSLPGMEN